MAQAAGQSVTALAKKEPETIPLTGITGSLLTGDPAARLTAEESESLFRSIANSVPTMIWMTGLDKGITFLNKVWFDFTGMTTAEALGQGWLNSFHPDDQERIVSTYFSAFQKRKPFTFEARKIYHSTTYRWITATGVPNFDQSGKFSGYIGICQDIHDRKQAAEEINLLHSIILDMEEVEDVDAALEIALKEICATTGWQCAQVWVPNLQGDKFELGAPWYGRDDEKLVRFRNRNRNQTFTLGKGLPGRVWQTKNPVWIGDLSLDSNFPRHSLAMDAHLKSALGVPVIAENKSKLGKKDVIAVLEFFQTETQERDEQVIRSVSSIALQLGLFIQKKQMEQVVRESEARFRIMADSTPAIIWITDVNDQVVYLNKQWVNHTGRSVEEVQGTTWWESVHPDDIEACYQRCRAAKEKRSDFFMEFRLKRADGIYRWMLDTATPRFDAEDRYIGYIGSMLDITELKLTEEKLKESELLFRSMAEASTQLIWLSDPEGRISYCNQAALEFSGKTLEEIRSFGFDQFIHPDDLQGLLQIRTGAIQSRTHYHYECRLLRKDGVYCWALIGAAPRFIGDGLYQGFVGSAIDITERKLAEEKLKESELRFRSMANSSPFMIIISDNSTGCFHFNQAWRDFTGLDYQSFCGRNWFNQVVHREDRASLISKYLKALRKGQVIEAEFRVRRYDGQYRWVYGAASPRVNDKENLFGFVGSWMDITERKQYREELEHTVEKRTAELEAVNRELESFSYSVSHDLRAPLRGIDGMSKVVLKNYQDKLDEKGVKYLEILRKEAQRMGDLINEMLSLSRLTRGELHWNTVDLSAIANEVANSLKQQEPGRIVNFKIKPGIIVQGDPHLLTAVMDNLLGNAWKFTSKHPEATIQFGSRKKDNQTVYFVKDDGAGFDMAYADQLFGAFQRLHTIEEFPGTGIGLATVQRIIHRHGGKVWAKGKVEKGAQIYFTLGEQHESIH